MNGMVVKCLAPRKALAGDNLVAVARVVSFFGHSNLHIVLPTA